MADCDYGTWSTECGCPEHHVSSCWPVPISCCPQLVIGTDTPPDQVAIIERSQRMAVNMLNALSGNQFGMCPRTVRPCRDRCAQTVSTVWLDGQLRPILDQGVWFNEPCGTCRTGCSCVALCEVTLPGPVERIIQVTVDGAVVPNTAYRVDNHRKLVRTDGGCWPVCQDMAALPTEPNTFEVQYLRGGKPVPEEGRFMAGMLACELVKACLPELGECALPGNVTQLAREGVTLEMEQLVLGMGGRTGIPEVDLWLSIVNPRNTRTRSRVYSPDAMPPRRRSDCA